MKGARGTMVDIVKLCTKGFFLCRLPRSRMGEKGFLSLNEGVRMMLSGVRLSFIFREYSSSKYVIPKHAPELLH